MELEFDSYSEKGLLCEDKYGNLDLREKISDNPPE